MTAQFVTTDLLFFHCVAHSCTLELNCKAALNCLCVTISSTSVLLVGRCDWKQVGIN